MNFFHKYRFELFLMLLQFTPIAAVGIALGSIYIFCKIAFTQKIDLLSIFLLLLPIIALSTAEEILGKNVNQFGETTWFKVFLPSLVSVVIIGPVAVSVSLFAALAVPFRLIFHLNNQKSPRIFNLLWLICLVISICGLYLAVFSGINSAGGLTVGFRIVLAVGAILLPLSIEKSELEKQLLSIVKISLVLFVLGLVNNHWLFVIVAFPPLLIFSKEKFSWKVLGAICAVIVLFLGDTFTIKLTFIFSFVFIILFNKKSASTFLLKTRLSRFFLFLFPILLMAYIVNNISPNTTYDTSLEGRFYSKLYADRGGIWKSTFDLIKKSDFFLVPAARDITVYDYGIIGESQWGAGAHNIFLEMARQLGLFVTIILTVIMSYFLLNTINLLKGDVFLSQFFLALFAVYLVFGLTGNSLIYDGVGFLFWLIIGQIYQVSSIKKAI